MSKTNWVKLREQVQKTDKVILTKVVQSIEGHEIYAPEHFTGLGLSENIVQAFLREQKSGKSEKSTIYVNNSAVKSLRGVHGLQLLEFIAGVFNVDSWKMGRGSRADHLCEQLVELWGK